MSNSNRYKNLTKEEKLDEAKKILVQEAKWNDIEAYNKFKDYINSNELTLGYLENLLHESLNVKNGPHPLKPVAERNLSLIVDHADIWQNENYDSNGGKKSRKSIKNKRSIKNRKSIKNKRSTRK